MTKKRNKRDTWKPEASKSALKLAAVLFSKAFCRLSSSFSFMCFISFLALSSETLMVVGVVGVVVGCWGGKKMKEKWGGALSLYKESYGN